MYSIYELVLLIKVVYGNKEQLFPMLHVSWVNFNTYWTVRETNKLAKFYFYNIAMHSMFSIGRPSSYKQLVQYMTFCIHVYHTVSCLCSLQELDAVKMLFPMDLADSRTENDAILIKQKIKLAFGFQ